MFIINLQGKSSIHEQIRDQILRYIKLGVLKADDKLPSVRQLAVELGINPNTVQKAYQELENQGYIYTLPKKGAFVSNISDKNENDTLVRELEMLFAQAKMLQLVKLSKHTVTLLLLPMQVNIQNTANRILLLTKVL